MKRILLASVLVVCMVLSVVLVACAPTYTLTLYDNDGKTVLYTISVKQGEVPQRPADPTKAGYIFKGWYITPTNQKEYDFSAALTDNARAYAQWREAGYEDNRTWVMVGSAIGWEVDKAVRFNKLDTAGNVFELTIDINLGDEWKCTVINEDGQLDYNSDTGANVGYALIANPGEYFQSGSGIGDAPKNVICAMSGNYTLTLTTDPANSNNSISVKRNGDVIGGGEETGTVTKFYIKGDKVTDWKDFVSPTTTLVEKDGVHTLTIYLPQGESFMFASQVTEDGVTTAGTATAKYVNLDEASKALFTDNYGNISTKQAGTYKFTYVQETGVLSATFTEGEQQQADYYIDGTFADGLNWNACFNAQYKLKQDSSNPHIYYIDNVELQMDGELVIQAVKVDSTEWGDNGVNSLDKYQYADVFNGGSRFSAVSTGNNNIKILKTSNYKITLNTYSNMITFEDLNVVDDAYIYGSMTGAGWTVDAEWKMTYNADSKTYTITKELKENDEFGIRICIGDSTEQRAWLGKTAVSGQPEGFDLTGSNIKCTTAGTYTIVVDMNGATPTITITSAA